MAEQVCVALNDTFKVLGRFDFAYLRERSECVALNDTFKVSGGKRRVLRQVQSFSDG